MNPSNDIAEQTAIVVGASRGLGRGIATALAEAGARTVAVARTQGPPSTAGTAIEEVLADAADPAVAGELIDRHNPGVLVVVAGAAPPIAPLQAQTWETFSLNWHADVRIAFEWVRGALLRPLEPGSRVIVISSGAALQGSPLSGGYAGAKATQRFISGYAQEEADRAGLGLTFTTLFPRLTPLTDLGRPAVRAYAELNGVSEQEYLGRFGEPLSPAMAGAAVIELLGAETVAPGYLLTGAGLKTLP